MATTRRHYIETTDVSGSTEAQVALAEELIDRYVGPQPKALRSNYNGQISALSNANKTISDTHDPNSLDLTSGYYANAVLEMVSGAAAGQRQVIKTSDKTTKAITLWAAFSTAPAVGDYFKIYQLAKFPRAKDVYTTPDGLNRYPSIPEEIREATAAQVEFIIAAGDDYFTNASADMASESFLSYSYTRGGQNGESGLSNLISPKAKALLRGFINRKGRLNVGGPYVGY